MLWIYSGKRRKLIIYVRGEEAGENKRRKLIIYVRGEEAGENRRKREKCRGKYEKIWGEKCGGKRSHFTIVFWNLFL